MISRPKATAATSTTINTIGNIHPLEMPPDVSGAMRVAEGISHVGAAVDWAAAEALSVLAAGSSVAVGSMVGGT